MKIGLDKIFQHSHTLEMEIKMKVRNREIIQRCKKRIMIYLNSLYQPFVNSESSLCMSDEKVVDFFPVYFQAALGLLLYIRRNNLNCMDILLYRYLAAMFVE